MNINVILEYIKDPKNSVLIGAAIFLVVLLNGGSAG